MQCGRCRGEDTAFNMAWSVRFDWKGDAQPRFRLGQGIFSWSPLFSRILTLVMYGERTWTHDRRTTVPLGLKAKRLVPHFGSL
jgi:hypothetical protein